MKHFTIKLMTVAATLLAFASCSKDDDGPSGKIDLKVQAVAPTTEDKVPDYSQFTVTVSSERDGKTMTESLDASGSATFNLDIGSYGIEIRGKENGKEYFGTTGGAIRPEYHGKRRRGEPLGTLYGQYGRHRSFRAVL